MSEKNNNVEITTAATEATAATPAADPVPVIDALTAKVIEAGGNETVVANLRKMGVTKVDDLDVLEANDLEKAGFNLVQARLLKRSMAAATEATAKPATVAQPQFVAADFASVLPAIPDEGSWLEALKDGGVLKIGDPTFISSIRAAFADRFGLYDIPKKLKDRMLAFAEENDEPVSEEYYEMEALLTERSYAPIFAAIKGLKGSSVTDTRRREFLKRINTEMWPAIFAFWNELNAHVEMVKTSYADPSMFFALAAGFAGGGMPAMATTLPSADGVRDAADSLKDAINHVFRGVGTPVASAMAYDASETCKILTNPKLPAMIGAANSEQMLKMLGANVGANYIRQEQNMVQFVLSAVKFDEAAAGDEQRYVMALWQIGRRIDWGQLGMPTTPVVRGLGDRTVL